MGTGNPVPDLDTFLAQARDMGPCRFVRDVPDEQRTAISAKVADGVRAWSAYSRWLAAQNIEVSRENIAAHFLREHADDR